MGVYNYRNFSSGLFKAPRKHIKSYLSDEMYRALIRVSAEFKGARRFQPGFFRLNKLPIYFNDSVSVINAFDEIFVNRIYDIGDVRNPVLLDVGANVGLAALYFKYRYGSFSGFCFEPDRVIADTLRKNLSNWACDNVEVVESAVGSFSGDASFLPDGADGGRLIYNEAAVRSDCATVSCVKLSSYLTSPVDLLKIDIEGHELNVFREISGCLSMVKRIFVEIHSFVDEPQAYWEIFKILQANGFRCYPKELMVQEKPFHAKALGDSGQFDFCLNVFAVRD